MKKKRNITLINRDNHKKTFLFKTKHSSVVCYNKKFIENAKFLMLS